MREKQARERLAIKVREIFDHAMGDRYYYHVRATVRQYRGTHVYGHQDGWAAPDDDYSPVNGWQDLSFTINSQGDEKSRAEADTRHDRGLYGWGVEYREVYALDLRKCLKYADTLKRIDRGLAKLQEQRGYARTFGQYVGRIAEVIGAEAIIIDRSTSTRDHVQYYGGELGELGDGINAIDSLIYAWAHPAKEAEAS